MKESLLTVPFSETGSEVEEIPPRFEKKEAVQTKRDTVSIEPPPLQRDTGKVDIQESIQHITKVEKQRSKGFFARNFSPLSKGGVRSSVLTLFSGTVGAGILSLPGVYYLANILDLCLLWACYRGSFVVVICTTYNYVPKYSHGFSHYIRKEVLCEYCELFLGKEICKVLCSISYFLSNCVHCYIYIDK